MLQKIKTFFVSTVPSAILAFIDRIEAIADKPLNFLQDKVPGVFARYAALTLVYFPVALVTTITIVL